MKFKLLLLLLCTPLAFSGCIPFDIHSTLTINDDWSANFRDTLSLPVVLFTESEKKDPRELLSPEKKVSVDKANYFSGKSYLKYDRIVVEIWGRVSHISRLPQLNTDPLLMEMLNQISKDDSMPMKDEDAGEIKITPVAGGYQIHIQAKKPVELAEAADEKAREDYLSAVMSNSKIKFRILHNKKVISHNADYAAKGVLEWSIPLSAYLNTLYPQPAIEIKAELQ